LRKHITLSICLRRNDRTYRALKNSGFLAGVLSSNRHIESLIVAGDDFTITIFTL